MNDDEATHDDETSGADLKELLGMSPRPALPSANVGDVIDHYRIDALLGAGGMGRVYRAHDDRLQRDVAVKLLAYELGSEAVALAKLAHPNVVAVFDVGTWNGHAWVAMEYVPGGTLRTWLDGKSPREVLAMFRAAGQGLAAAHAAGLVHRDFKPDNVLIDREGRARVADFGIAGAAGAGPVAGTVGYMAPEQKAGGVVDARADQYAFAVALKAALGDAAPPHVATALERSLAEAPADRFPDMPALLAELDRDPARRRRRIAVASILVAAAGSLAAFAWWRGAHSIEPCSDGGEAVARIWDPIARARAVVQISSLHTPYAAEARDQIASRLDAFADGWSTAHDQVCREHRAESLSTAAFDRRTACLSTNLTSLATARDLAFAVDREHVADLVAAVTSLPAPATCPDDTAVPPTLADKIHAVDDQLARAAVERDAAQSDAAERDADAALKEARAINYAPLLARALVNRGRIDLSLWRGDRGAAVFTEATSQAIAGNDDALAVEAFARAAYARSTNESVDSHATEGLAIIEAIVKRLGTRAEFARALLDNNLGAIALAHGDRDAARNSFTVARAEAEPIANLELTNVTSNLILVTDDDTQRAALGTALIARRTELVGASHPLVLQAAIARAELLSDPERARIELAVPCRQTFELHPEQQRVAMECGLELVWLDLAAGDASAARQMLPAALSNSTDVEDPSPVIARAYAAMLSGDLMAAKKILAELTIPVDDTWWFVMSRFDRALALALVAEQAKDNAAARAALRDATDLIASLRTKVPPAITSRREHALAEIAARL
ncbi:MAG: serine/threonine-protein kinase [Kofleriaceae bacterium]